MQVWTTTQQYSSESRLATWPIMVILIKASPILGLGPSNYYHYTPLFPLLGWYVKFNSHNNYVDLLASTGLLGLGIFLWIAMELARLAWRLRKTSTDRFSLAYVNGCLGGLVAMLASGFLGDWFLPFTYNVGFPGFRAALFAWIFLGGLVAIDGKTRKRLYDIASKENSED
jgi:O-antigen ligase